MTAERSAAKDILATKDIVATEEAPPWPADRVERRPLAAVLPAARNAKTHSPEQIAQLAESIRRWGWTVPVLVDEDDVLIAGHGRVLAAKSLGLDEIPVMVARGWSEEQRRAYRLADNRLAENGAWDDGLLSAEVKALNATDPYLLMATGFPVSELRKLVFPVGGKSGGGAATTLPSTFQVIVTCETEKQQLELLDRLSEEGMKCRALMS